jgi:hypothetical protein
LDNGSATLADDDVEVELNANEDAITGTVMLAGEEPLSFTADAATDAAGMYVATESAGEVDLLVRWVVMPDGRQRGELMCCAYPVCMCCGPIPVMMN